MINKFQQGGKQDAVMQFIQGLALTLLADPNLIIQIAQLNPKALEAAVQIYQQTQDMNQAAKAFQQGIQSARRGAKLNYIKSLKHQCADDEELYYYKTGGSIGCGCKKKEDGGEIAKALKGTKALDLFKKRREEQKRQLEAEKNVPNHAPGGTNKSNRFAAEKYYRDKNHKNDYSNNKEETTPPKINKGYGKNEKGGKVNKNCGGSAIKKFKMHRLGGSLNGVPFIRKELLSLG